MCARFAATRWLALALSFCAVTFCTVSLSQGAQPLPAPSQTLAEPLAPMIAATPLVNEVGFFARWRADHRRRAARDGYIETDRPSFTLSDSTVPDGWLQVETGYEYWSLKEAVSSDIDFDRRVNALPNLVVRYGLNDWIELRAQWDGVAMVNEWFTDPSGSKFLEDDYTLEADLKVGVKLQTTRGGGFIPKSALVTNLRLPTGNGGSDDVDPEVFYIYSWAVTERFSIGGTSGLYFSEFFSDPGIGQYAQSVIGRWHYSPAFDLFYEFYWLIDDGDWNSFMDAGLRWRPLANLQFDWKVGSPIGGEPQLDGIFTGVGVSFRY